MKRVKKGFYGSITAGAVLSFLLAAGLVITACALPNGPGGPASLRILMPGGDGMARAAIGDDSVQRLITYAVTLRGPGAQTINREAGYGESLDFSLESGDWTIEMDAYFRRHGDGQTRANVPGSQSLRLEAGKTETVDVSMRLAAWLENLILIPDAEELAKIADTISFTGETKTYLLLADLTLNNWRPVNIGDTGSTKTFDGGGHTITVNGFDTSAGTRFGIFGTATESAIKNLNVSMNVDHSFSADTNFYYIGAAAGYAVSAQFENIQVSGTFIITVNSSNTLLLGGIAGELLGSAGLAKNCSSSLAINGSNTGGGQCAAGGITGVAMNGAAIMNSGNTGPIAVNGTYAGGIAGFVQGSAAGGPCSILECYNKGNITGDSYAGGLAGAGNGVFIKSSFSSAMVQGGSYAGGIIGRLTNSSAGGTSGSAIAFCYSAGDVQSNYMAGGIAGEVNSTNPVSIYLENLYSSAPVHVNGTGAIGGLFGVVDMSSSGGGTAEVTASYALNPLVEHITTGTPLYRGRVLGNTAGTVTLTNLHGLTGMVMGIRVAEGDPLATDTVATGATTIQGANFTPSPNLNDYSGFLTDAWIINTAYSSYPVLQWQIEKGIHP